MTMAETTIEKKPWWVSEDERHGLENVPQHNLAENVVAGIPDLKKYEGGSVIAEYGIKDGLIVYHFYKKDRREVFLEAHRQMDAERDPSKNKEIARNANAALNTMPWWDDTEENSGKLSSRRSSSQHTRSTTIKRWTVGLSFFRNLKLRYPQTTTSSWSPSSVSFYGLQAKRRPALAGRST